MYRIRKMTDFLILGHILFMKTFIETAVSIKKCASKI